VKGAEGVVNARQILLSRSSQVPGDCHALDSGGKIVAMIKSADSGHENDSSIFTGIHFRDASSRRSFIQCQIRPVFVVVADILFQKSSQVTLVQHDDMIEQVPAAIANPAFCDAVLPRASEAGPFWLKTKRLGCFDYFGVEVRGYVKDQILRGRVIGEYFTQLLCDPCARWMAGDLPMHNSSLVMRDYEQTVQHSEGQGWHGEKVHRSNNFPMIAKEGRPTFCWKQWPRKFLW